MCRVDPFAADSPLKQTSVDDFPPDLFFVLRVVQLIRQAMPVLLLQFMLQAFAPACLYNPPLDFFCGLRMVPTHQAIHADFHLSKHRASVCACMQLYTIFLLAPSLCRGCCNSSGKPNLLLLFMFVPPLSVPPCICKQPSCRFLLCSGASH